jgi:predicted transport protein
MTRRKNLGNLGEDWTVHLLREAGFRNVRDLNEHRYNHPGGDFLADRQGVRYFITVKARNKYRQGTRSLNGGYNIYPAKVRKFAQQYDATPAWLTIQVDTDVRCFSAFFGKVGSLRNPSAVAVPMTSTAITSYECLAKDRFDARIVPELSNQLEPRLQLPRKAAITMPSTKKKISIRRRPAFLSFDHHYSYTDSQRQPLLNKIRHEVLDLDDRLIERITAGQRIAYSKPGRKVFLEVKIQRHAIVLHMIDVPDPDRIMSKIPESHEWGQLTGRVAIKDASELERALPLIRTTYLHG